MENGPQKFELVPAIREKLLKMVEEKAALLYTCIIDELQGRNIVSPPEQLFYATWNLLDYDRDIGLEHQEPVGRYFVDFRLNFETWLVNNIHAIDRGILSRVMEEAPKVVIEIDGDWRGNSMDRAEYDREKELDVTAEGYAIIRFTAREVLRDVEKCVEEVYSRYSGLVSYLSRRYSEILLESSQ